MLVSCAWVGGAPHVSSCREEFDMRRGKESSPMRLYRMRVTVFAVLMSLSSEATLATVSDAPTASIEAASASVEVTNTRLRASMVSQFDVDAMDARHISSRTVDTYRLRGVSTASLSDRRSSGRQARATSTGTIRSELSDERGPNAWLMTMVILLLVGYQLRRKHRLLRPHRFHRF